MQISFVKPQSRMGEPPVEPNRSASGPETAREEKDFSKFVQSGSEDPSKTQGEHVGREDTSANTPDQTEEGAGDDQHDTTIEAPVSGCSAPEDSGDDKETPLTGHVQILDTGVFTDPAAEKRNSNELSPPGNHLSATGPQTGHEPEFTGYAELEHPVRNPQNDESDQISTASADRTLLATSEGYSNAAAVQGKRHLHGSAKLEPPSEAGKSDPPIAPQVTENNKFTSHSVGADADKDTIPALTGNRREPLPVSAQTEDHGTRSSRPEPVGLTAVQTDSSKATARETVMFSAQDLLQPENSQPARGSMEAAVARAEAAATSTHTTTEFTTLRPETMRNAASQAVEVFVRQPGRAAEIALNPEELGRVRMTLSTSDTGVTIVITSERPETLDLMRRHIDQLAQEFIRMGFGHTEFQFGQETSGDGAHSKGTELELAQRSADQNDADNTPPSLLVSTGLDLRL